MNGDGSRNFPPELLLSLRELPLSDGLDRVGLFWKPDLDFSPLKDARTVRWHVSVGPGVSELLVTGSKWFDAQAERGGGGCIDLVMHVLQVDFVQAVKLLSGVTVELAGQRRRRRQGQGQFLYSPKTGLS